MVIQSYDVKTTSDRTFLSVQSLNMLAVRDIQLARNARNLPLQTGPQISQGAQGNQNSQGAQGNQNSQGAQGNQNSQGAQGNQNSQGAQGNQNSQGAQGNQNSQGENEDTVVLTEEAARKRRGPGSEKLRQLLKELRNESLTQLAKGSSVSFFAQTKFSKKSTVPSNPQELKAHILQMMLELLGGKKPTQKTPPPQQTENNDMSSVHGAGRGGFRMSGFAGSSFDFSAFFGINSEGAQRSQLTAGWRVEQFQYEFEQVSYQAKGVVHTADGRTINVDIHMQMSREFTSYMEIDIESRLVDPLVINYGGTAASLMGDRFQFDLTMDGNMDNLAVLGEGSGFLAVDWNGDGVINDGSELFGPSTGCGFSELRQYDTDGNGWIDENDEIFDKLVVWHRDKDGNDTVFTLRELGIGAIYLGDIATEFSFKDETNQTLGVMRSTSFFLKECGGAGTVSHIDMTV